MKVYHRTSATQAILAGGFKDTCGSYGTAQLVEGVWVSDRPLDGNSGAYGDTLLVLEIPEDVLTEYEWVQDGNGYREFLVPAQIVNQYELQVRGQGSWPESQHDEYCECDSCYELWLKWKGM
jgi:hypothetical protein